MVSEAMINSRDETREKTKFFIALKDNDKEEDCLMQVGWLDDYFDYYVKMLMMMIRQRRRTRHSNNFS